MPLPSISSPVEYPAFQLTQGYSFVTHYLILFLEWCLSKPCQSIHPSFLWMSLEFIIQCTVISLCVCVVIHKPKRLGVVIECVMSWSFLFKKKIALSRMLIFICHPWINHSYSSVNIPFRCLHSFDYLNPSVLIYFSSLTS